MYKNTTVRYILTTIIAVIFLFCSGSMSDSAEINISLSPPSDLSGWKDVRVADVIVTLSAEVDYDGPGVKEIHYVLNGETSEEFIVPGDTAQFTLSPEKSTVITYWAVDNAGNVETQKTHKIGISDIIAASRKDRGENNAVHTYFILESEEASVSSSGDVDDDGNGTTLPDVTIEADPSILWPPNNNMVDVFIDGSASDDSSGISDISFTVTDEYGIYEPEISDFGDIIQLEAWRDANDKNGRTYTITVTATDNEGNQSTASTTVVCPHDNSAKKDSDGDDVPDSEDNCPAVANPFQSDTDEDGLGDVCDNCLADYNPDQAESDGSVDGMVSYWRFNEGVGLLAYDTIYVNDGTIRGAEWGSGMFSGALWFRGTTRHRDVYVNDNPSLDITLSQDDGTPAGITIETWVYGENFPTGYWATIVMNSTYGWRHGVYKWYDDGYGLYYIDGYVVFFINHYENNVAYSTNFAPDMWHHVVGTYDGSQIRLFVDGVEGGGSPYAYSEEIIIPEIPLLISGT